MVGGKQADYREWAQLVSKIEPQPRAVGAAKPKMQSVSAPGGGGGSKRGSFFGRGKSKG